MGVSSHKSISPHRLVNDAARVTLTHTFSGNPLDRGDLQRRDEAWLEGAARDQTARFVPMWRLNVLLRGTQAPELGWLSPGAIDQIRLETPPVFLGLRASVPHFAVDISHCKAPVEALGLNSDWQFEDCRAAAMRLDAAEAGILAQCRSQIDWHRRHTFCGVCGSQTQQARGGHVRRCGQCSAENFPRTDPVVIMVIADGERCLLGQSRGRLAQSKMYSALAGFIDQGESIEEAVRREVGEEAGIEVGDVRYHSSQPWPFPSSLMVGCHGVAASTDIEIDTNEMTDVSWFSRDEVLAALRETNPNLRVPGVIAIAHHLIKAWAYREVEL